MGMMGIAEEESMMPYWRDGDDCRLAGVGAS